MSLALSIEKYIVKHNRRIEDNLNVLGAQMVTWAQENLDENIYSKAIPVSSKGKPKWIRTGNLKNSINYATSQQDGGVSGDTTGTQIARPSLGAVRCGGNLPYLRRIELGFQGEDSLGRNYNQSPVPFLRPILGKRAEIMAIIGAKNV